MPNCRPALVLAVLSSGSVAHADSEYEVPALVFDSSAASFESEGADEELDLANIVQSAVKGVTTVQEAPAIVTVITADEIRDRGYLSVEQLMDSVPGWMRNHGLFDLPGDTTRGIAQAMLFMHDGISLYDPFYNCPSVWRVQAMENIKRVEMVTGPGGVLWGANSFLGVMNVISKDAEDVDGVETGISAADGYGDRRSLRGYVMAGIPELFSPESKLFVHASFESYQGALFEQPAGQFFSPPPQPSSTSIFGPLTRADPARSMVLNLDGKLTVGALSLAFQAPFAEQHTPIGFGPFVVREEWEEDALPECVPEEPLLVAGDRCIDKGRTSRDNRMDWFDRYVVAEHHSRSDDGTRGVAVKAYGIQFERGLQHVGALSAVPALLEGGLSFETNATSYRAGGGIDGDVALGRTGRVLYGFEGFRDWTPSDVERARQGDGVEATFFAPLQLERLPLPCPKELDPENPSVPRFVAGCPLTFSFPADRTVLGVYLSPQWRPSRNLILDAGARIQAAPAQLGGLDYAVTPLFSGSLVYQFRPDWHLKVNYAEGFRPPAFEHTNGNGEAVQISGDRDLVVETSQAGQAEINARVFKGERSLRELTFRADYSYTRLDNFIQLVAGSYENTAARGIHSAELLGHAYLQGGHRLELGYTFLRMSTGDIGRHKALPEHWFHVAGIFQVSDAMTMTTNLRVVGALENPNLLIEYRDVEYADTGEIIDVRNGMTTSLTVDPHEVVLDRIAPTAELTLGLAYQLTERLRFGAFTYNTFGGRIYQAEPAITYEPRLRYTPSPLADFSARVSLVYAY